jgi:hypothetical protein
LSLADILHQLLLQGDLVSKILDRLAKVTLATLEDAHTIGFLLVFFLDFHAIRRISIGPASVTVPSSIVTHVSLLQFVQQCSLPFNLFLGSFKQLVPHLCIDLHE